MVGIRERERGLGGWLSPPSPPSCHDSPYDVITPPLCYPILSYPILFHRPFWLSPRQALVVPVSRAFNDYGKSVRDRIHRAGFYVDLEDSTKTLNKKIREGQVAQYNFILVVGEKEQVGGWVDG